MEASVLVGCWNLQSFFRQSTKGKVLEDGRQTHRKGRLHYLANGYMASIIIRGDRPAVPMKSFDNLTDAERISVGTGFLGYSGNYRVEENRLIHAIDLAFHPWQIGTEVVRIIESYSSDEITLSTIPFELNGEQIIDRLIWKRV